jgi:hypothetical protein
VHVGWVRVRGEAPGRLRWAVGAGMQAATAPA